MDRQIVYPGSVPLETDILNAQVDAMVALGYAIQAALGSATFVDGLTCAPTSPASMSLTISPGCLGALTTVDATAFSSVAASTDPLVKLGINRTSTTLTFVAPTVSGTSQNFLIQAAFAEADATPISLPYFNSANPAIAWSGPNNSGTAQNTVRAQRASITVKSGVAATTGSQTTPAPDAGWSPLYVVTLSNGTVSITIANIVMHPSSPAINYKIPSLTPGTSKMVSFTSSGQWVVPNNARIARLRVWGAGGSGGSSTSLTYPGGGGGAGGYSEGFFTLTPGALVSVTVGATAAGSAGGSSSFGALLSASGGGLGANGTNSNVGAGAAGGTASGGTINIAGGSGTAGIYYGTTVVEGGSGAGSFGTTITRAVGTTSGAFNGNQGFFPGGGGSGCTGSTAPGGGGLVVVEY